MGCSYLAQDVRKQEHADLFGDDSLLGEKKDLTLALTAQRQNFVCSLMTHRDRAVAGLAWAILVESALLNDHLVTDMRQQAAVKNSPNLAALPPGGLPFYLPVPPPEAREAFNEYVRCRWPVHVFALDPVVDQENVSDVFSMRRELQLAMAVGFTTGQINAQNMTRFARQIELNMETIALHRTVVGFSHGADTFGWRFYPRIQTPEIESNFTTIFRDQLIGGPRRDALIKDYRIEPGIRECVALVIMPSFVPYVNIGMRSNWFKLTDPKKKVLNSEDAVELGRAIGQVRQFSEICLSCTPGMEGLYRPEDLSGLLRTVQQIETRLPFQSTMVQVPYENTLGGFEMFSTGVTDLAPELRGFYGEPGVALGDAKQASSTVYLVGNHFSVHETRVIAGNVDVTGATGTQLISRTVYQVTIPPIAQRLPGKNPGEQFIDVHVATPYGISNHLLIPVSKTPPPTTAEVQAAVAAQIAPLLPLQQYVWSDPLQTDAYITYDLCNAKCLTICREKFEIKLVKDAKDATAIPPALGGTSGSIANFGFWIVAKNAAKEAKKLEKAGILRYRTLTDGKLILDGDFTKELQERAKTLDRAFGAQTLEIYGFLQFPDANGCAAHCVRLGNVLTFVLKDVPCPPSPLAAPCLVPCPACPTVAPMPPEPSGGAAILPPPPSHPDATSMSMRPTTPPAASGSAAWDVAPPSASRPVNRPRAAPTAESRYIPRAFRETGGPRLAPPIQTGDARAGR